ncbi:MAG: hypothetical protein F4Y04_02250 [Chloroflexi bacterium]|nr:hypothetical protein [Chloroflexota bacterium]
MIPPAQAGLAGMPPSGKAIAALVSIRPPVLGEGDRGPGPVPMFTQPLIKGFGTAIDTALPLPGAAAGGDQPSRLP